MLAYVNDCNYIQKSDPDVVRKTTRQHKMRWQRSWSWSRRTEFDL